MKCDELKPLIFSIRDLGYVDEPTPQPNFQNPHDHAVYKATEVDAAIAELKEFAEDACIERDDNQTAIDELEADYKEACGRLQTANLIKDEQLAATRHSKRKRCLNKAEWCEERCARYDLLQEHSGFSWRREIDFYFRWYQRWLELAEKFKEAK